MLKKLKIENFKSLKSVQLEFGQLNIVIGANASGKSNLFDALRFLQGVGNGFSLGEIIDGKPKSSTAAVWDAIRGGSSQLAFAGNEKESTKIDVSISTDKRHFTWGMSFSCEKLRIKEEWFGNIYDSRPVNKYFQVPIIEVRYYQGNQGRQPHLQFESHRPVISQFADGSKGARNHRDRASHFLRALSNMQRVDPWPAILRDYSQAQEVMRMGEHGENFAALVKSIINDPQGRDAFLTWLRHLRPAEVDDVKILEGAVREPLFCLLEGQKAFPAPVLSDGTLRFAAITAALFQPDMPGIMTIEEIENGIHASRLRLLVELLRSQAGMAQTQLFVTTHSPVVLAWLKREELKHTFYCKRDAETGESKILPVTSIPHFEEIIEKQSISDLFSEGWMESAL